MRKKKLLNKLLYHPRQYIKVDVHIWIMDKDPWLIWCDLRNHGKLISAVNCPVFARKHLPSEC